MEWTILEEAEQECVRLVEASHLHRSCMERFRTHKYARLDRVYPYALLGSR